jgi:hypothetical protein
VTDLIAASENILSGAGYSVRRSDVRGRQSTIFENGTVLGFIFGYSTVAELLKNWTDDANTAISSNQLGLRRVQLKAWNAYSIFLASGDADFAQTVLLGSIEEDLTATRKIAKGNVASLEDVHAALLPLLPIQSAPQLEAVDMKAEVRLRTSELPARVVQAYLSEANEPHVARLIEEEP